METLKRVVGQENLEDRSYVRWDDPRVQEKPEGEDEDIQAVAQMINEAQRAQYNSHRHCFGGLRCFWPGVFVS
jgi:hypothetical protein